MHTLESSQDAQRLIEQAQESLSQIRDIQLAEGEEAVWRIEFDDGGDFWVEWSETWARLVLTADLPVPPAGGELAALNLALSYNALWRDVGALRIARDGDEGGLLLIGELGAQDGEPQVFNAALLRFEALRQWWSEAVTGSTDPKGAHVDQVMLLGRI